MSQPVREQARAIRLSAPPLESLSRADLWALHTQGLELFRQQTPSGTGEHSWLSVKATLAARELQHCNFCVHHCNVNRSTGEKGYCRLDAQAVISGAYVHQGEEAPISPTFAIFFGGCTMHCVYCHNWRETFNLDAGQTVTPAALVKAMVQQQDKFRTLSLIGGTPEPHLHTLLAMAELLPSTLSQPLVFNGNATLSDLGLTLMEGVIDIYLPDYKHGNDRCAWRLTQIAQYTASVQHNLRTYQAQGARIIIRHLILPNHLDCCTRPILEWLADHCPQAEISLLEQYRPLYKASTKPDIARRPSPAELAQAKQWLAELKLTTV